jgi:MerR family transcriptional regulator/heat shock protein HspR
MDSGDSDRDRPLYMISVAAELTGVHPQTLRIYEAKGLVTPKRSAGNTRLYSQADIERLELIGRLTDEGINLAGVMRILDMQERMQEKDAEIEKLRRLNQKLQDQVHELEMRSTITSMVPVRNNGSTSIQSWKQEQ